MDDDNTTENSVRSVTIKFKVTPEELAHIDAMKENAGAPTRAAYLLRVLFGSHREDLTDLARALGRLGLQCNQLLESPEGSTKHTSAVMIRGLCKEVRTALRRIT